MGAIRRLWDTLEQDLPQATYDYKSKLLISQWVISMME